MLCATSCSDLIFQQIDYEETIAHRSGESSFHRLDQIQKVLLPTNFTVLIVTKT